jgi:hypothetical protein
MGACLAKKRVHQPLPNTKQPYSDNPPSVFICENFKIVDFTRTLKDISKIEDASLFFPTYRPTEIRCVKGKNESKQEHSHLLAVFGQKLHEDFIRELGIITDYSPYGFSISIGDMKQIKEVCKLKNAHLEHLYLPKVDNQEQLKVSDVLEWAYLHKDEQYMNPLYSPELDMGKRIFNFVLEKLSGNEKVRNKV